MQSHKAQFFGRGGGFSSEGRVVAIFAMGSEHLRNRDDTICLSIVHTNDGTRVPFQNTGGWRPLDEKNRIQVDLAFAKHLLKTAFITTGNGKQLRREGGGGGVTKHRLF